MIYILLMASKVKTQTQTATGMVYGHNMCETFGKDIDHDSTSDLLFIGGSTKWDEKQGVCQDDHLGYIAKFDSSTRTLVSTKYFYNHFMTPEYPDTWSRVWVEKVSVQDNTSTCVTQPCAAATHLVALLRFYSKTNVRVLMKLSTTDFSVSNAIS